MFEAHFCTAAEETLTHPNPPSLKSTPALPKNQDQQRLFKRAVQHPRYNCSVWIWNAFGKKVTTRTRANCTSSFTLNIKNITMKQAQFL